MDDITSLYHQDEIWNFPWKLYHLLTEMEKLEFPPIHWNQTGDGFIIKNKIELCQKIIPNYFKLKQFKSFTRQLNIYGFSRPEEISELITYSHPKFLKGRKDLLAEIKRVPIKNPSPTSENDDSPTTLPSLSSVTYYAMTTMPFPFPSQQPSMTLPPPTTYPHGLPWFPFDSNFSSVQRLGPGYSYIPARAAMIPPRKELFPIPVSSYHWKEPQGSWNNSSGRGGNLLLHPCHPNPSIFSPEEVNFLQEVFTDEK